MFLATRISVELASPPKFLRRFCEGQLGDGARRPDHLVHRLDLTPGDADHAVDGGGIPVGHPRHLVHRVHHALDVVGLTVGAVEDLLGAARRLADR